MSWPYELRAIASIVACVASSLIVENGFDLLPAAIRKFAERLSNRSRNGVCAKFRPVASHGSPCRYSKTPHRCDKRRHDRIGDHQRERRRVSSSQEAFSTSSTISYRTLQASASQDIVLPSKALCPWPPPDQ